MEDDIIYIVESWGKAIILNHMNHYTTQKMKFSIKDFFNKYDQIRRWSHLMKKSLMENFIFVQCERRKRLRLL